MFNTFYDAIIIDNDGNIRKLENINEKTLKDALIGCADADIRYHEHNSVYHELAFWSFLFQ